MLVRLQGDSCQKPGFLLISALLPPNLAKIPFNQTMVICSLHVYEFLDDISNVFNELTLGGRGKGVKNYGKSENIGFEGG